jgi:hypothetical protein
VNENDNAARPATPNSSIPTPDEARDWLRKHLARAPERSEQWYREVLDIYRAGRREPIAEPAEDRVA